MVGKRGYNNLEDVLLACSKEQLRQIMHLWGLDRDSQEQQSPGFTELYTRMHDDIGTRFVWEALSSDERQILYHALSYSARVGLSRDALQKKSQVPPEQYEPAINNLLSYCLLFQQQEEIVQKSASRNRPASTEITPMIYPFKETLDILQRVGKEMFTPLGDRSECSLAEVLAQFHDVKLYQGMRMYNVEWGTYYSRAGISSMIVDKLMELDEPVDYVKTISKKAWRIYGLIREQGGRVLLQDVRTQTKFSDHTLYEAIHELDRNLLAFDTLSKQGRLLFIPHDLYEHLKPHSGQHETQETATKPTSGHAEITPAAEFAAEPITLYDIAIAINSIYQYTIEPTQVGRVPKRLFNKISPLLKGTPRYDYDNNDIYLEMLLALIRQQGLLQLLEPPLPDIKARYEPGPGLEAWSRMDGIEQASTVLQQWVSSRIWSDLQGVNFKYWDPYSWQPGAARPIIIKHLGKLKAGQWYRVDTLLNAIWEEDAFALHPAQPYARKADRQKTYATRAKWDVCDGELYTGILSYTLYEMGIVSLGYEASKELSELRDEANPSAFMLTEFGATVLSHLQAQSDSKSTRDEQEATAGNTRSLVVQPNFELLLLQPDFPTLYSVLPFAQINQIGLVSRLTLTRASLLRGLEGGKNVEQVIHNLEKHSQKELPQNVVYTLNDWAKNFKDARISKVLLFEVSSEATANELAASPKLAQFGIRRVAPCLLVLSGLANLQEVRRILEKEGITVHLDGSLSSTSSRHPSSIYGRY